MILAFCAAALVSSPARAQDGSGAIVSGSIAAAVTADDTNASLAGAVGYRFNRVIGLGVELTSIPRLKLATPDGRALSAYENITTTDGRTSIIFFTTNVRVEIPTTSRRILPFAVGGGGVASTRQEYTITVQPLLPPFLESPTLGGSFVALPSASTHIANVSTGMALTLGGGVSILATQHVAVDVDARTLYVRGNPGGSIGRFAAGVSYRF